MTLNGPCQHKSHHQRSQSPDFLAPSIQKRSNIHIQCLFSSLLDSIFYHLILPSNSGNIIEEHEFTLIKEFNILFSTFRQTGIRFRNVTSFPPPGWQFWPWPQRLRQPWRWPRWQSWNPSIYNILHWVAWTMGQTNRRPRVCYSMYYFFNTFYRLRALKTIYFYFL